jgi:class 3 adenylate cyclase
VELHDEARENAEAEVPADRPLTTASLPSGLVTFVLTDIEGSTRLLRRLGEAYEPVLERHRQLLRSAWAMFGSEMTGFSPMT